MANEGKKILVVDNDGELCEKLSRVLRERGYQPLVRRRGEGLVKLVKDEKPATVVLELSLPDYDGQVLLKQLKDDWDAKKVPVVVVSEYTSRLNARNRDQAEALLSKPIAIEELAHRVELAAA